MNVFFHSAPLHPGAWIRIIAAGIIISATVGMEKSIKI